MKFCASSCLFRLSRTSHILHGFNHIIIIIISAQKKVFFWSLSVCDILTFAKSPKLMAEIAAVTTTPVRQLASSQTSRHSHYVKTPPGPTWQTRRFPVEWIELSTFLTFLNNFFFLGIFLFNFFHFFTVFRSLWDDFGRCLHFTDNHRLVLASFPASARFLSKFSSRAKKFFYCVLQYFQFFFTLFRLFFSISSCIVTLCVIDVTRVLWAYFVWVKTCFMGMSRRLWIASFFCVFKDFWTHSLLRVSVWEFTCFSLKK